MSKAKTESINYQSLADHLRHYKKHPFSLAGLIIVCLAAVVTVAILLLLVGYILIRGIPNITPQLFEWEYNSDNVSMMPAIINTITMTLVTLLIAVPVGVFSAIYLVEYAKRGNKIVGVVRTTTETLAGIPSIVYGLFGYLIFVVAMRCGLSMLSGALTLAIMVLPTIMRTTEEALKSVPHRITVGDSRNSLWCYFGDRSNRRRDGGFDLYFRHGSGHSGFSHGFRTYAVGAYVCAFIRRLAYQRSICHSGRSSDHGHSDQRAVWLYC